MSYLKENVLATSLKRYILDVKPFHTKLNDIQVNYKFDDICQIDFSESKIKWQIYFQNIFDTSLFGGWKMYHTVDSTSVSLKRFLIPQTIIPRWSLDSFVDQFPLGNNPAREQEFDGPVNEDPWALFQLTRQGWSWSHQQGVVDEIPFIPAVAKISIEVTNMIIVAGFVTVTYTRHIYYDSANAYGGSFSTPTVLKDGIGLNSGVGTPHYIHNDGLNRISVVDLEKTYTLSIDGDQLLIESFLNDVPYVRAIDHTLVPGIIDGGDVNVAATEIAIRSHVRSNLYDDLAGIGYSFTGSGAYRVPFHQGSYITVDGVPQVFNEDYIVTHKRDSVQWLSGKHPAQDADIRINFFNVDRLFIAHAHLFATDVKNGFDDRTYDMFPFDAANMSGDVSASDYFELKVDFYLPNKYTLNFFNQEAGTVKATLKDIKIYDAAQHDEVWTIKAISTKVLSVFGNKTGDDGEAHYYQRYDNGKIAFTVRNEFLPYYMVPDNPTSGPQVGNTATYSDFDMTLFNVFGFGGTRDTQDYLINLNIISTHGIDDNFNAQPSNYFDEPVELNPFGKIVVSPQQLYYFEVLDTPLIGSVYEFIVEQNSQYNTWVQVHMGEKLKISDLEVNLSDYLDITKQGYDIFNFDEHGIDAKVTQRDEDGSLHTEPYQLAATGFDENLVITINYVDATPDIKVKHAILRGMMYQQEAFTNDLILKREPEIISISEGNGYLDNLVVNTTENWTLTALSASSFSVVGSITGTLASATVGVPYVNSNVSFTIVEGWSEYEVGDQFLFSIPPFTSILCTLPDTGSPYLDNLVPDKIFLLSVTDESPAVVGTGNGGIRVTDLDQGTAVPEVWTITATSPVDFTVVGSISGAAPNATVGVLYTDKISFKITAGGTPFVAGDKFEITVREDWTIVHVRFNALTVFDLYLV